MDDLYDIKESEFITDTDDQDSLDEKIDTEQRIRNQQLWASFQNAACCITKLYRDRTQPNVSPWVPFQNAASNLTTLYKDCIESQRRFARIGYQVGRKRRLRELRKLLKKHNLQARSSNGHEGDMNLLSNAISESNQAASSTTSQHRRNQQQNAVSSILAVNQLNLECEETASHPMEDKGIFNQDYQAQQQSFQSVSEQQQYYNTANSNIISHHNNYQQQNPTIPVSFGNNEEDLVTFQQALVQPAVIKSIKIGHNNRRPSVNAAQPCYINNRSIETKSEEDRLLELNQFLSEEYHRHVGSRKRSCASIGGSAIKRARE